MYNKKKTVYISVNVFKLKNIEKKPFNYNFYFAKNLPLFTNNLKYLF